MLEFKITHLNSCYSRKREITLNKPIIAIKWNSNARLPEIITETNSFPRTSPLRDHLKWLQLYKKIFGEESKNPSPAHCNLQFLNTGLCGLYQMIKKKWAWFSSLSNWFELKQHIAPRQMILFVVGRRQTIPNAPGNAPLKIWSRPSSKKIKPMSKIVTVKDCNSATSN